MVTAKNLIGHSTEANKHLLILSGFYGILRPLDFMAPYRLEMGTRLAFDDYKTLYNFWENKIVNLLNRDLKAQGDDVLVNLASNEYFKSIIDEFDSICELCTFMWTIKNKWRLIFCLCS